jgi:hypothetical protein
MASSTNKQHLLHALDHALTGELAESECEALVHSVANPHHRFLAYAACMWNTQARTTPTMRTEWKRAYARVAEVRDSVHLAIENRTRFPQCRTGLAFGSTVERLTDFAFVETNGMSIVECFLRSEKADKQWLVDWLQSDEV